MSRRYALTCSCGETHQIEARQAGTTVQCSCGKPLRVPSLRELAAREPADAHRPRQRLVAVWGRHQMLLAIGAIVTVAAALGAVYLHTNKPRLLDVDQMPPIQTWMLWQELRQGPDRHLSPDQQHYVQGLRDNRFRLQVMLVLVGLGATVVLAGLFAPKQWRRGSARESRRTAIPP